MPARGRACSSKSASSSSVSGTSSGFGSVIASPRRPALVAKGKVKLRAGGLVVERDPETVDSICLHQSACLFGATAEAIRRAGGDGQLARHRRALDTPYHLLAYRDGVVVHAHALSWYTHHGNGWNARSIGIAVEGIYHGPSAVEGELPDEAIHAGRVAIAYAVDRGRAHGMPISRIVAHRQSSPDRRGDPGCAIWRALVLEYAVPVLGLVTVPDEVLTVRRRDKQTGRIVVLPGRPIPRGWDPSSTHRY